MFNSKVGITLMTCAAILIGVTNYSHAQYSGPGSDPKMSTKDKLKSALGVNQETQDIVTVRELKRDPVYDKSIVLKGRITKKTDKTEYRFEDETGDMKMIIGDKLFKGNLLSKKKISETTVVEVTGVLKKERRRKDVFTASNLKVVK